MFHWARVLFQLQIGVAAVIALLLSVVPLAGSVFGAGRQIAFESDRDGNWEIYLMDVDRRIAHNLTRSPDEQRSPAWLSDGRALAYYSSYDNGRKGDIYVIDVASGGTRQLTTNGENNWQPAWSPDGKRLVYLVNYGGIILADADGGNGRRVGYGFRPSWSPDSRRIIYYADRQETLNADLYFMDINDSRVRNLSLDHANDFDPAWSPDGRWIAFTSSRSGNGDIYVMPSCDDDNFSTCSQAAKAITHNRAADISPAWSPDSRQIAFTSDNESFAGIYIVDADGGNLRGLTGSGSNNRLPAWRPG
jgi:Tol biopolymer transport system component